jgi:imidazolonepropionase-like amidohydrolase
MLEYIKIGYLIDGTGNPIQKNIVLTVKNNIISAIDPFHERFIKKITRNLATHTIVPILADAHVHLAMSGTLNVKDRRAQLSLNFDQAKKLIKQHLDQYSKAGIGMIRDGGDQYGHTFHFKNSFHHSVDIKSPNVAWFRTGRYGQFAGKPIDSTDNYLDIIFSHHQGDHIKIIQSGINSVRQFGKKTIQQFSQDEMTSICNRANQRNIPIMVHANGVQPVKTAIDSGCTSIEHGYFMGEENLKKIADKQIYWVPTLIPMYELAKNLSKTEERDIALRTFDDQCKQVQKAKDLGVQLVLGSDAGSFGVNHVKGFFDEMKMMQDCGFTLPKIIQCCTSQSRSLMNSTYSGLLKTGERAQFLAIPSDPDSIIDINQ